MAPPTAHPFGASAVLAVLPLRFHDRPSIKTPVAALRQSSALLPLFSHVPSLLRPHLTLVRWGPQLSAWAPFSPAQDASLAEPAGLRVRCEPRARRECHIRSWLVPNTFSDFWISASDVVQSLNASRAAQA